MIGFGDLTLHYGLEAQRGRSISQNVSNGFIFNIASQQFEFLDTDDRTSASFRYCRLLNVTSAIGP